MFSLSLLDFLILRTTSINSAWSVGSLYSTPERLCTMGLGSGALARTSGLDQMIIVEFVKF